MAHSLIRTQWKSVVPKNQSRESHDREGWLANPVTSRNKDRLSLFKRNQMRRTI